MGRNPRAAVEALPSAVNKRMRKSVLIAGGIGVLAMVVGGCRYREQGFESPEPADRVTAAAEAARVGDQDAIPHLIEMLEEEDPLVRMMAIRSLEELTGQTLGYEHAGPRAERQAAVDRWTEWYRAQRHPGDEGVTYPDGEVP
jgi:HEAT repeat protein